MKSMMNKEKRRCAAKINNEGVRLFESSKFEEAKEYFLAALQEFTEELQAIGKYMACLKGDKGNPLLVNDTSDTMWFISNGGAVLQGCESRIPRRDDNIFIYRKTLSISIDHNNVKMADSAALLVESTAVLFNIAVTHHVLGLVSNQSDCLEKAMHLYNIAALIRGGHLGCQTGLMDLAIVNNAGQIYHEFADQNSARICFDQLSRGISFLRQYGLLDHIMMHPRDKQGFILNIMISLPNLAAAA